jgi:hypothetical protein
LINFETPSRWNSDILDDVMLRIISICCINYLQAAFYKYYGCYSNFICPYNLSLGHMLSDMFHTNR